MHPFVSFVVSVVRMWRCFAEVLRGDCGPQVLFVPRALSQTHVEIIVIASLTAERPSILEQAQHVDVECRIYSNEKIKGV